MIQYKTVLNINVPQMNLFLPSRNSTVETISKQLEYVTKGHVATKTRGVCHEIKQRTRFRIFGILGKDSRFQKVFQIHLNIES